MLVLKLSSCLRVVGISAAIFFIQPAGAASDPWVQSQSFSEATPVAGDRYGSAISVDGDVVAIGAPNATVNAQSQAGLVQVWRHGATWVREATLTDFSPKAGEHFGSSVLVRGDSVYAGAPERPNNAVLKAGIVYVAHYQPTTGAWIFFSETFGEETNERFGSAFAIDGNLSAFSSPGSTNFAGGYVEITYDVTPLDFNNSFILKDPDATLGDNFGASVALYRSNDPTYPDLAVIGAPNDESGFLGPNNGLVYVFANADHIGHNWQQVAKLAPDNIAANQFFGVSVAVGRDRVVIGAPNRSKPGTTVVPGAGSVSVYIPDGAGGWAKDTEIFLPTAAAGDALGQSVAYDRVSGRVFGGAPNRATSFFGGSGATGAVEVFQYERLNQLLFGWKNTAEIATIEPTSPAQSGGFAIAVAQGTLYFGAPDYDGDVSAANSGRVVEFIGDAIFANGYDGQ